MTSPAETPHLTHLTLTDDEFRILNGVYMYGLAAMRGSNGATMLLLTLHMAGLLEELGWDSVFNFTKKLDDLGAANPNFDSQGLTL